MSWVYKGTKKYWWDPKRVCLHESGHAVVAHRLGVPVTRLFIHGSGDPDLERLELDGGCEMDEAATAADNIVIVFGGLFAECLLNDARLPNFTDFGSVEFSRDLYRIRMLSASDRSITPDVMSDLMEQTKNLVLDNERYIRNLARALWEKKLLNEDDLVALLGARARDNVMSVETQQELIRKGLWVEAA